MVSFDERGCRGFLVGIEATRAMLAVLSGSGNENLFTLAPKEATAEV